MLAAISTPTPTVTSRGVMPFFTVEAAMSWWMHHNHISGPVCVLLADYYSQPRAKWTVMTIGL